MYYIQSQKTFLRLRESKCRNSETRKNLDALEESNDNNCVNSKIFTVKSSGGTSGCTVEIKLWVKKKRNKETNLENSFSSSDYYGLCDSISDRKTKQKFKLMKSNKYFLNNWKEIVIMTFKSLVLATGQKVLQIN